MDERAEIARNLTICALCVPVAAITWFVFHGLYVNLSETERAIGYVDPMTQTGIDLGYVAMVGGTLVFAGIAVWTGLRAAYLWLRGRA